MYLGSHIYCTYTEQQVIFAMKHAIKIVKHFCSSYTQTTRKRNGTVSLLCSLGPRLLCTINMYGAEGSNAYGHVTIQVFNVENLTLFFINIHVSYLEES